MGSSGGGGVTARRYTDPAERAEACSPSLVATVVSEKDRESARRYVARRARDGGDEQLLLAALGLDQPPA
ncbi:hypothetical protein [Kitasatospora sp. NPDC057738]|uniref:hypothetical protein n=1 Tax=Kitasatospora sp. NPDC057738 TaxID=3346233 RepID=UPI0036B7C498